MKPVAALPPEIPGFTWSIATWDGGPVYQAKLGDRVAGQLLRDGDLWVVHVAGEAPVAVADLVLGAAELGRIFAERRERAIAGLERAFGGHATRAGWSEQRLEELRTGGRL